MIGSNISHYRVVEEIGRGGMGIVYKAVDTKLDRTVALKFLPPGLSGDSEAKQRFIQEAKSASSLDHQNICTIHEIGEDDEGRVFIAMACYEGRTIRQEIADESLSIEKAINFAAQTAEGLAEAHAAGIIHRDIKPGNLMVTGREVVKILDFGLAKVTDTSLTTEGKRYGTIVYMSPEQARGERVTFSTDIWSMGAVIYEMLTGVRPFDAPYDSAIFYAIINVDPIPPSQYNPEISAELEAIVLRCLAKNVEDRYRSAGAVAEVLARLSSGLFVQAEGETQQVKHQWTSKKKAIGTASLFILLVAIAAGPFRQLIFPRGPNALVGTSLGVLPAERSLVETDTNTVLLTDGILHYISSLVNSFEEYYQPLWSVPFWEIAFYELHSSEEVAGYFYVDQTIRPDIRLNVDGLSVFVHMEESRSGEPTRTEFAEGLWSDISAFQINLIEALENATKIDLSSSERQELISKNTANPDAFRATMLGWGYLRRPYDQPDYPERAVEQFQIAVESDSSYALARALLSSARLNQYGFAEDDFGLEEALESAEKAIELDSLRASFRVLHAYVLDFLGRSDEAETAVKEGLRIDPNNRSALGFLADLLDRQNRSSEVEELLLEAQGVNPFLWKHYEKLGDHYSRELRYQDAIDQYQEVVNLSNRNAWGYAKLASQYLFLENYEAAETLFVQAAAIDESADDAKAFVLFKLGEVRYRQDDFVASADYSRRSIAINDTDFEVWSLLGDASHWLRDDSEAIRTWTRVMDLVAADLLMTPDLQSALEMAALTQAKLGNASEAIAAIDKILTQARIPIDVQISIAIAQEILNRREEALTLIKSALQNNYSRDAIEASRWLDDLTQDRRYRCEFEGSPCID